MAMPTCCASALTDASASRSVRGELTPGSSGRARARAALVLTVAARAQQQLALATDARMAEADTEPDPGRRGPSAARVAAVLSFPSDRGSLNGRCFLPLMAHRGSRRPLSNQVRLVVKSRRIWLAERPGWPSLSMFGWLAKAANPIV